MTIHNPSTTCASHVYSAGSNFRWKLPNFPQLVSSFFVPRFGFMGPPNIATGHLTIVIKYCCGFVLICHMCGCWYPCQGEERNFILMQPLELSYHSRVKNLGLRRVSCYSGRLLHFLLPEMISAQYQTTNAWYCRKQSKQNAQRTLCQ